MVKQLKNDKIEFEMHSFKIEDFISVENVVNEKIKKNNRAKTALSSAKKVIKNSK